MKFGKKLRRRLTHATGSKFSPFKKLQDQFENSPQGKLIKNRFLRRDRPEPTEKGPTKAEIEAERRTEELKKRLAEWDTQVEAEKKVPRDPMYPGL